MANQKVTVLAGRAWSFVRLALLWSRKRGVFVKRSFISDRRRLKRLPSSAAAREREFSFDESPQLFQFKLSKSSGSMGFKYNLPCVRSAVDDVVDGRGIYRLSYTPTKNDDRHDADVDERWDDDSQEADGDQWWEEGYELIDEKAEEFIANFHRQMRLQAQLS